MSNKIFECRAESIPAQGRELAEGPTQEGLPAQGPPVSKAAEVLGRLTPEMRDGHQRLQAMVDEGRITPQGARRAFLQMARVG